MVEKSLGVQDLTFLSEKQCLVKDIILELNNTYKHANSTYYYGKTWSGKTQFLLKILTDIRCSSNYQTNFIFFDYKGDVVDNQNIEM